MPQGIAPAPVADYEPPEDPAVHLQTGDLSLDECAAQVQAMLEQRGFLRGPHDGATPN